MKNVRTIRLRFRRRLRKGQKQVEGLSSQAEAGIERNLFKRFDRLKEVRRFVFTWLTLVVVLIGGVIIQNVALSGYFQTLKPVPGGIFTEGILGTFSGANPLYATSDVDLTVSHLIFTGLFTHDTKNNLVGSLATNYTVDAKGSIYTVHLKPGLTWQDGQPLTSTDVLYTYQSIQNPDAQSPLRSSWQGITITAPNPLTIVFQLPGGLASFPYNLTNGIVPKHILGTLPAADLRTADFNTLKPLGAGPFKWQTIQVTGNDPSSAEEQIALVPFDKYTLGRPKIDEFIVHAFTNRKHLVNAFKSGQVKAIEGFNSLPKEVAGKSVQQHSLIYDAGTYVFFRTGSGVLASPAVRQALVRATNVPVIINSLGYTTRSVREPLLTGQAGYDPAYDQPAYNLPAAKALLDKDGWVVGKDGIRRKDKQPLIFSLAASDTNEYANVSKQLESQWKQLGVELDVQLQSADVLQYNISKHAYDALLYGISIGQDPDVFVYWDSSQANVLSENRLNLSEYKSAIADTALEAGRTRIDPHIRSVKYKPFLQAWQQDAPAVGLYQPRLLYISKDVISGLSEQQITVATDRFSNVQNWQIRRAKVTN